MELQEIVDVLAASVPETVGTVLCDFEGETVVLALGAASAPQEAEARAAEHVPRAMALTMPVREFLVRLGGAEPCALLRMLQETAGRRGAGQIRRFELRYDQVDLLVDWLPNDFYLVLVMRRPALIGPARYHLGLAAQRLAVHLE